MMKGSHRWNGNTESNQKITRGDLHHRRKFLIDQRADRIRFEEGNLKMTSDGRRWGGGTDGNQKMIKDGSIWNGNMEGNQKIMRGERRRSGNTEGSRKMTGGDTIWNGNLEGEWRSRRGETTGERSRLREEAEGGLRVGPKPSEVLAGRARRDR
jgi:hypothetical protein